MRAIPLPSCLLLLVAAFNVSAAQLPAAQMPAAQASPAATQQGPLVQAQDDLEHGKAAEAIALLQPLASANPPLKGAARELGLAYYRTGKLLEAVQ